MFSSAEKGFDVPWERIEVGGFDSGILGTLHLKETKDKHFRKE